MRRLIRATWVCLINNANQARCCNEQNIDGALELMALSHRVRFTCSKLPVPFLPDEIGW